MHSFMFENHVTLLPILNIDSPEKFLLSDYLFSQKQKPKLLRVQGQMIHNTSRFLASKD